MWIVRLALRKPYTFTVMAVIILILGAVSFRSMAKDIFPNIDIPVVSVIWGYTGLPPQEMERRFVTISERAMNTTVNDIEHQGIDLVPGYRCDQGFLSAQRQDRAGCRAGYGDQPDAAQDFPAGRHAAAHHPV